MAIDPRIREAIEVAVEEGGQDTSLSRKLVAWFEELSSGNEGIDDAERHLKLLYDSTTQDTEVSDADTAREFAAFYDGIMPDAGDDESDDERSPDR